MNNAPQPQPIPPTDADMALLFLGSWFEKLLHAPERHQATLDALAGHINAARIGYHGSRGEMAPPTAVNGGLRQAPALGSGRSRCDRRSTSLIPA